MKKGSRGKEGNLEISKRKKRRSESKGWGQNVCERVSDGNGGWKTGVLKRRCFHVHIASGESRIQPSRTCKLAEPTSPNSGSCWETVSTTGVVNGSRLLGLCRRQERRGTPSTVVTGALGPSRAVGGVRLMA